MKFNQKTIRSFLVLMIVISTLAITGLAIYYFGFQTLKRNDSHQSQTQPTFLQTEINWITKDQHLILPRFQKLLEAKRPEIKFNYAVDDLESPQNIKVSYFFKNQVINWFYELKYSES